jgi:PhnB protein
MKSLSTYLYFNGNCEQAFQFYESTFVGKIEYIGRYKDLAPEARAIFPNTIDDQIMHITLRINADLILMGADRVEQNPQISNFAIYINTSTKSEAQNIFDLLSSEGSILVPLENQFWNSSYGQCIDKFGISWKVNWSEDPK